jgi:hypothetical protein
MSQFNNLEDVINEWQNNPAFKEQFKKNPEKALNEAGLKLNAEDLKTIKFILKLDDDGLPPIINK